MLDSQIVKIDFVKVVDVSWFESQRELFIQYSCRVATFVGILPRLSQCLNN